jgi:hypothetical protein
VVEGPVGEGLGGHLAEPVVEGREPLGDGRDHRDLLGGVAGHDLGVLVIARQAAHLAAEGVHIIEDETVHRRRTARVVRGVERRLHRLIGQEPVVFWCHRPEQLGVGVGVLLARVGVGRVHRGRHVHRHHAPLGVWRVARDGVRQVAAGHALEGRDLTRVVQITQQVVEGPVLEHHRHHVVEPVRAVVSSHHQPPSRVGKQAFGLDPSIPAEGADQRRPATQPPSPLAQLSLAQLS